MTSELRLTEKTNGLVLILFVLAGLAAMLATVRPQRPSPFSAGTGYGAGYGTDSIMFGAGPRNGAGQ